MLRSTKLSVEGLSYLTRAKEIEEFYFENISCYIYNILLLFPRRILML